MPIHIIKVKLASGNALFQPRNLFIVRKNAQMDVIETYISDADNEAAILINGVSEIALEENAHFFHYDIQKGCKNIRKIQRNEAVQQKHSNYSNYTFTFPGSSFTRNNLTIHLNDEAIESHLYGLYLTAGEQLVDNHTEVHHKKPNGESNQLYKGIIMDKSKAVFNGKIYVYEDAQKTNAFQQSNNVLFGEQATVHAKPQLEIFADDVKCSHGTTIGQLNKEAIFYLKSRGIGEEQAKQLMVKAFAFDVAEKIKIPALRSYVEEMIIEEMKGH
ncbi:FeS cluster assembly protein SufD [compost metagenome]